MDRDILHLSVPAFPVALARVADSSLRERPVAVAPGHSERALLQCVSAEARAEGVHEGMAVYQARRCCPALTLLSPDPEALARGMRALTDCAGRFSPLWEAAAPGRLFLDLTGTRRLFGPGRDAAARLEREIGAGLRLHGGVGLAGNKLVSRIAAGFLQKPGVCDVLRGSERSFIAPLPVSVLPGVGQARAALLLSDLNLRRVGEVAALPLAQLRLAFGSFAPLLRQRAQGIDPTPVQPPRRAPEVAEESFLPRAENDDALLAAELCRLAEGCGLHLRRLGKGALRLTLSITYADGVNEQRTANLPAPLSHDRPLFAAAEDLFARTASRRVRIRAMRLACGRLTAEERQLELFAAPIVAPQEEALQDALDRLRGRHGREVLCWGRAFGHEPQDRC
ncbi:MAG: DNA polymerase IV [Desulfuromonadales bacterium]